MMEQIFQIPAIKEGTWYYRTKTSLWLDAGAQSEEFTEKGGFGAVDPNRFSVLEREGSYRIRANIIGLEDSFLRNTAVHWEKILPITMDRTHPGQSW